MRWTIDWRLCVVYLSHRPASERISPWVWSCLGPAPKDIDTHRMWRYRMPLWWCVASTQRLDLLNYMRASVDFSQKLSNGAGFLYAALTVKNPLVVQWALDYGLPGDDTAPTQEPLLVHAMSMDDPKSPVLVPLLLRAGASWYYKSPLGISPHSFVQAWPVWLSWFQKFVLLEQLQDHLVLKNDAPKIKRKM